jgi:uncharacterized membrane protein YeaQ/YmgE (transglycosylase-associated protein family)
VGIVGWIVLGLLAGLIAKAIMPGAESVGIIVTILLGIAGALLGGFLATALDLGDPIDASSTSAPGSPPSPDRCSSSSSGTRSAAGAPRRSGHNPRTPRRASAPFPGHVLSSSSCTESAWTPSPASPS